MASPHGILYSTVATRNGAPSGASGENRVDLATLRRVAATTGGRFFRAEDGTQLDAVYRGIDRLACDAWFRRLERGVLRFALDVEHLLHLVGCLAEHERAAQIGLVALDAAAAVDQQNRPFLDGNAENSPTCTPADPWKPSRECAADTSRAKSFWVIPSLRDL